LAHDRLVYGKGNTAYVVAIAEVLAATPHRLAIVGTPPLKVIMDQSRRLRLVVADGGAATWTIPSAPAFVKLRGSELLISPTAANLGHYDVAVKATRDDSSDTVTISLDVGVPVLELGFHIQGMALNPAGKAAIVWGRNKPQRPGYDPAEASEPTQFALVDLDELKVLARQVVKAGIQLAALDDKYIYMALASGNVLYRLDRSDLSSRKRLFVNGQPLRMEILPDGNLAIRVSASQPFNSVEVYDRETLVPNAKHFARKDSTIGLQDSPVIAERGPDGTLIFNEKIVDAATGEMRCATEFNALPALADAVVTERHSLPGRDARAAIWARRLSGTTLISVQGSRIAEIRGSGEISSFDPLAACVRSEQNGGEVKTVLEFREIKAGEIISQVDLGLSPRGQGMPESFNSFLHPVLQMTKDKVVYRDGSRLVVCPIFGEVKKKAAFPLALKIPKVPVASVENSVKLQFAVYDVQERPTYSLTKEYEGLSIDAAQGMVTIDLPKIWKAYLANGGRLRNHNGSYATNAATPPDMRAIFERLTGTPLPAGKMAFRLPLRVAVTNDSGESDELRISLIVTAPKADVDKVAAQQLAEQTKVREEMLRRQEESRAAAVRTAAASGAGPSGDGDRVSQLESRVRRLEASLDAVLQKLDRLENAQKGEQKRDGQK
jgi:hypothetical protein